MGVSRHTLEKAQEVVEAATKAPELFGDLTTKMDKTGKVNSSHRELKKRQKVAELRMREQEPAPFEGVYDVITVDPAWPGAVQAREERPQQVSLPYLPMTLEEIQALSLPMAKDYHIWLWTTHRFLFDAFRCLEARHLKYICCFVWEKTGGMQPMDLPQFSCSAEAHLDHEQRRNTGRMGAVLMARGAYPPCARALAVSSAP